MKFSIKQFLTAMCLVFSLNANVDIETANIYADTGFFDRAEELYRQLLSEPLEPWQQDILYYNLGTLYVKQELWDEAIEEFIEINGRNLPSDFIPKLKQNLSTAINGVANRYKAEGDLATALVFLSIDQEKGELFHEVWNELPEDPARNSLLRALRDDHTPDLQHLDGYSLELAKLATNSTGVSRKVALIAALEAVNRQLDDPVHESKAVNILKNAIEEQQRSWDLAFLTNIFKMEGPVSPQIIQLIEEQQKAAIQTARTFVPAAEHLQQEECQKLIWKNVFPPFGQGLQAAEYSEQLLQKKQPLPIVDDYQSETLKLWMIALKSLEFAESAKAPEETKVMASRNVEQLIQTVIEMDFQDEISEQQVPSVKRIDKPW